MNDNLSQFVISCHFFTVILSINQHGMIYVIPSENLTLVSFKNKNIPCHHQKLKKLNALL